MQKESDVHLVLFKMTTKDQIIQVLKEARRPIKAREIARRYELHFNERISKREVNRIIHNQLKSEVASSGFPRYTHSLIKVDLTVSKEKTIQSQDKKEEINVILNNDSVAEEVLPKDKACKMLDDYIIDFHKFRSTKDNSIRDNCLLKLEEIIEYIIFNKLNIDDISSYLEKEVLIHKQVLGDKRVIKFYKENFLQDDRKDILLYSSTLNNDLLQLIQKFESVYSDFTKLNRKPDNIKISFSDLINELDKQSFEILDLIVKNILTNNVSLSNLEDYCSVDLYSKIEKNEEIYKWVNKKEKDQSIDLDTYEDRLKEFKILYLKVWEDGVVDESEQKEIDERIITLGLDKEDAQQIFKEIEQDFKIQKTLEDSEDGICIKKVKDPKRPLECFYKGASQEVLIDENVSMDELILAICELDLNNQNQKILKKINRIIENDF